MTSEPKKEIDQMRMNSLTEAQDYIRKTLQEINKDKDLAWACASLARFCRLMIPETPNREEKANFLRLSKEFNSLENEFRDRTIP